MATKEIEFKLKLVSNQLHSVISTQGLLTEKNSDYDRSLGFLGFSARVVHALRGKGIITLGDLLNTRRSTIMHIRNIGVRSINEINRYVAQHNLVMKD